MRVKQSALELIKSVIEESFSAFPGRLIYIYIHMYIQIILMQGWWWWCYAV